jgi:hypothetical protein
MANARRRKNFIHPIHSEGELVVTQAAKQEAIFQHFLKHTGTHYPRHASLKLGELGWESKDLQHLDQPFSE